MSAAAYMDPSVEKWSLLRFVEIQFTMRRATYKMPEMLCEKEVTKNAFASFSFIHFSGTNKTLEEMQKRKQVFSVLK